MRSSIACTNVQARAAACKISYQARERNDVHASMSYQCRGKLSHEVTKKVIKAALKLCMHVIRYI